MSICGRAAPETDRPLPIDRLLRGVIFGAAKSARQWGDDGLRFGLGDDAEMATAPGQQAALFNGRLDNREELAAALRVAPRASAASLALAAYAKWGVDFADHVIGDWSIAIWDGARRRLLLATDVGENWPLFYWLAPDGEIRFASSMAALWSDGDVPRVIDEARMAEWLSLLNLPLGHTMFTDIRRVAGGTVVVWDAGKISIDEWWQPDRLPMLRLKSDNDYVEAMRAAFDQAVAWRIAGDARIGSNLSGGLDSSAVTAFAARQLAERGRSLTAFTATPEHGFREKAGRFGDEWSHAAAVAAMYPNIDHVRVSNDDRPLAEILDLRVMTQDTPPLNPTNMVWGNAIDREARDRGVSVMLTGQMGNMTLSYNGGMLLQQLFRRGRIDRMASVVRDMRRVQRTRWLGLGAMLADAMLPPAMTGQLRRWAGKESDPPLAEYSAVTPALIERSGLGAITRQARGNRGNLHRGDSRALRLSIVRFGGTRGDYYNATRRLYGVDTRDPTADRRLIELCLQIPEDQYLHRGLDRSLARRILRGMLPDLLVDERRKGWQGADWAVGFEAALPALREEVARARTSRNAPAWIDIDRVAVALDNWPGAEAADERYMEYISAVSRGVSGMRFVRKIEGGNS